MAEVSQREEEKIHLKSKDFIIIIRNLTFPHCIFLDFKEIYIGERERI